MPLGSALNSLLLLAKNLDSTKSTIYTGKKGKPDKPVVFDRNGYLYHGIVKSIADGARKAGVRF